MIFPPQFFKEFSTMRLPNLSPSVERRYLVVAAGRLQGGIRPHAAFVLQCGDACEVSDENNVCPPTCTCVANGDGHTCGK
jgi:hypothetical protein